MGGAGALALLAAATALIAPAGVLGTALIAIGRVRPVAVQVGASLSSTSSRLPRPPGLGAGAAALGTVAAGGRVALLAGAAARAFPGLFAVPRPTRALAARPAAGAGR